MVKFYTFFDDKGSQLAMYKANSHDEAVKIAQRVCPEYNITEQTKFEMDVLF